ncbi:AraC family transcriptional regulator ligand-binding domain-containing protein [Rhizobium calliandrae]|uniref:AraC family transcriptional regulator ligand-binding domain-containing protein n=1 Tax=Rhizobium calliandrae TaxID=1312182 RepID=A0ABT7KJ24_9HYPH|nr:AraC family transcriptional regulator [Rhizobium calliandrae]MDL2408610.1 AraC family transcriptional regulator ligand-binding domain-containing protein [Rhizobium calliandrae]
MITRDEPNISNLLGGPTAWGLATRLAVKHLEHAGIDPAPLLLRSKVPRIAVDNGTRISVNAQIRFLELAGYASNDGWIGLTLAGECDLREMGMLYYVAASSHQLGDALRRVARYGRLGNEALVVHLKETSARSIGLSYSGVQRHQDRHQIELFAFVFLRLCRRIVGRNLTPAKVTFVHHRSGDLGQIWRKFGCEVEFDTNADEIIFDPGAMELPLAGDDPFLNELIVKMCEEAIAVRSTNVSPFRIVVENTIAPLLPHAEATTRVVARQLGLSERTFARRLAAEGLSFGDILDALRRDLALRYLDEDLQSSQIAWLLGFHQPSSFSHACRRWTGKSPSECRRARTSTAA